MMFDSFQNSAKGKGKEKDVGKRRAYVRVVTSLGGGLNLELFCEKVSRMDMSCVDLRNTNAL
jgi:peptidyl-prolyl cis-trans isomerase-like 2